MTVLQHLRSGKVREIYEVDAERLLIVATDRISVYDVVLSDSIPDKGKILTGLTLHWLGILDTPNHLLSVDPAELPGADPQQRRDLVGRMMLVRRAEVIPMECVVRGYLYGSAWEEYSSGGGPTTEHLSAGLRQGERLEHPVFTPAHKATAGHDENLTEGDARRLVGDALYEELRTTSIELYDRAAAQALSTGLIIADTKFEFGIWHDQVILIDEVLTPDSSRYWPVEGWQPGATMPSFDKQYVRDAVASAGWKGEGPVPRLSDEVIAGTRERYLACYQTLTERPFQEYLNQVGAV